MSKLPFFTLFFVLCACSPSEIIEHDYNSIDQTPLSEVVKTKIETYVSTNHPNNSVVGVGVEPQVINVKLNSNIEILFSLSGDFTAYDSVNSNDDNNHDDGEYNSIDQAPLSEVVKTKIKTYISTNHPSNSVVEVDIENQTIEIELNNNVEILFSLSGDFIAYDNNSSNGDDHDDGEYNSIDQTPLSEVIKTKIKTYVSTNHPNNSIVEVDIENQTIEIELNNNIEILFSLSGDFIAYDNDSTNDDHDDGEYNSIDQTPLSEVIKTKIKTYISTNHPSNSVVEVDIENQTIEIELNNNVEILFSLSGDFIAYDNNSSNDDDHDDGEYNSIDQTPLSEVVKTKIKTYISTNHPNKSIVEVDIENQTIEVELNNNVEILFSLSGDFIAYDDD